MTNVGNRSLAEQKSGISEQMRGVCEYLANGSEPCGLSCAACEYFHTPFMEPKSSRMRHISEVLDEVMRDLSKMRAS